MQMKTTTNTKNKSKLVRIASPPRQETEKTFLKKLEELRQQRNMAD